MFTLRTTSLLGVVIFAVLLVFVYHGTVNTALNSSPVLKVVFPFGSLKKDQTILDPNNTNSIWEYYLLENLAIGLVREDLNAVLGYGPALASEWHQVNDKTWLFTLDKNSFWSSGKKITAEQIKAHFERIVNEPSRHQQYLKNLVEVKLDQKTGGLLLVFRVVTGAGLLHELSLADSSLCSTDSHDWSTTSGAYYVASYDFVGKKMLLKANQYFKFFLEPKITEVQLYQPKDAATNEQQLSSGEIDIQMLGSFPFSKRTKDLRALSKASLSSVPASVFFFAVNEEVDNSHDAQLRKGFASLIAEVFGAANFQDGEYERQLIPKGYLGHLEDVVAPVLEFDGIRGKVIDLDILRPIDELGDVWSNLVKKALDKGLTINLKFRYSDELKPSGAWASTYIFKGNQKDPVGSWTFLTSQKGPISLGGEKYRRVIEKAIVRPDRERFEHLIQLHKEVLNDFSAIPFLKTSSQILHSSRVDASKINLFDMRPRFYEMKWK